jgi:hypothetical protein
MKKLFLLKKPCSTDWVWRYWYEKWSVRFLGGKARSGRYLRIDDCIVRFTEGWPFGRSWRLRPKKTLGIVSGQCPIAALTSVQCLSCAKHVTIVLRLHSANFDDSLDPPSSGAWDSESIRCNSYESSRTDSITNPQYSSSEHSWRAKATTSCCGGYWFTTMPVMQALGTMPGDLARSKWSTSSGSGEHWYYDRNHAESVLGCSGMACWKR